MTQIASILLVLCNPRKSKQGSGAVVGIFVAKLQSLKYSLMELVGTGNANIRESQNTFDLLYNEAYFAKHGKIFA